MTTNQSAPAVLVVEDEWLIADHIANNLRRAGCRVIGPASRLAEAVDLLGRETPGAALLDIGLGQETSYPIADALAARNVPFAFVSAYQQEELPVRFASRRVLIKPFGERQLRAELDQLL